MNIVAQSTIIIAFAVNIEANVGFLAMSKEFMEEE
jgi:hypothetical protein